LPHGLSYDSRLQVYNFMREHLQGQSKRIEEEPPVAPEPDATLYCAGGNVDSLKSATPFSLNRARETNKSEMPLDRLLRLDRPPAGVRLSVLRRVPSKGVWVEAVEVQSSPRVWIPAWLFRPRQADAGKPAVLALDPVGRAARWHEGELYQNMALKGYTVCVPDLRGIGDMSPEFSRGNAPRARSHQDEENYSWASMILGKPLVGQRTTDILALTSALRGSTGLSGKPVVVASSGKLTLPALFAAALDPKIGQLYLSGGLVSYRSILETEEYTTPFAGFVPDILLHTDLPEIIASLAPRRVCLAGGIDASGDSLPADKVRAVYTGSHIEVRPRARWDEESLSL
jgi:hypothetical protein